MVETATFVEATLTKLAEADVIMAIGIGDRRTPKVLIGRERFAIAASNRDTATETNILRVTVAGEEEFEELKNRVKEAKGELDPV